MKIKIFVLLASVIFFSCQKELSFSGGTSTLLPTITTTVLTSITNTTALSGGNISSDGGATVTARGVCWSTAPNPVVTDSHTTDGTGTGLFISALSGLNSATLYYVRAYATNSKGTAYGNEISFTTSSTAGSLATVTTTTATSITTSTAASGGDVTADGGAAVTARGICWGTSSNPVVTGNHTTDGSGIGIFTSAIIALSPSTVYYVRAYATNANGTAYGNEINFTTSSTAPVLPTIITAAVTSITATTVSSGGSISSDGGAAVTARGVCWSTTVSPVVTGSHTTDGTGTGTFASAITGLSPATMYHVRAYATNSVGTAYGNDLSFTTTSTSSPDVYVAGYEYNGSNNIAKYWKNGVAISLTTGANDAGASSIFIDGSDVYVAGYEMQGSKMVAKYWKNGVAVNLTNGAYDAVASKIIVVNTDVYVSGFEGGASSSRQAKYWKNGTVVTLAASPSEVSIATSIAVSGTDVYVTLNIYTPAPAAVIMKNGIATDLSGAFSVSSANAVFINSTDVYVAGRQTTYKSTYWKNGIVNNLPSTAMNTETEAFSVFVSGSDIYISGYEKTTAGLGNIEVAKYWKNGLATNITNGTYNASADAIVIFGADIYAAGYEENAAGNGVAKYWKNGVAVSLTDGSKDAGASAILVK